MGIASRRLPPLARFRRAAVSVVAVLVAVALPGEGRGQGTVHATSLQVRIQDDGAVAAIQLRHAIRGVAPGDTVTLSLLDFPGGVAEEVQADGRAVDFTVTQGAARRATVALGALGEGEAGVTLVYAVRLPVGGRGGSRVIHLPLPTVDLPPEAARAGLFKASVEVPEGWKVTEGFPTGLKTGTDPRVLGVELQVVPSVVTLRARTDGRGGVGLPLVLDAIALAGLALFSLLGWRFLHRSTA